MVVVPPGARFGEGLAGGLEDLAAAEERLRAEAVLRRLRSPGLVGSPDAVAEEVRLGPEDPVEVDGDGHVALGRGELGRRERGGEGGGGGGRGGGRGGVVGCGELEVGEESVGPSAGGAGDGGGGGGVAVELGGRPDAAEERRRRRRVDGNSDAGVSEGDHLENALALGLYPFGICDHHQKLCIGSTDHSYIIYFFISYPEIKSPL